MIQFQLPQLDGEWQMGGMLRTIREDRLNELNKRSRSDRYNEFCNPCTKHYVWVYDGDGYTPEPMVVSVYLHMLELDGARHKRKIDYRDIECLLIDSDENALTIVYWAGPGTVSWKLMGEGTKENGVNPELRAFKLEVCGDTPAESLKPLVDSVRQHTMMTLTEWDTSLLAPTEENQHEMDLRIPEY